jgi:hypothetical protein
LSLYISIGRWAQIFISQVSLDEGLKLRLHFSESGVDVLSGFGSGDNDFARCENKEAHFWVSHLVNEARKSVGIERAILLVLAVDQSLQIDLVVNTTGGHHVLHGELRNFDSLLAHLLNGSSIMLRSIFALLLTLSARDDHLSGLEN